MRRLTLGEIEAGTRPPDRWDYATVGEYVEAFHYWRAVHRDAVMTAVEGQAWLDVVIERLAKR